MAPDEWNETGMSDFEQALRTLAPAALRARSSRRQFLFTCLIAATWMATRTTGVLAQGSDMTGATGTTVADSPDGAVDSIDWKDLPEIEKRMQDVYRRVQNCIVHAGGGTGTIISDDGLVLTAHHVIQRIEGDLVPVTLSDGRSLEAKKLGWDFGLDMALLKIVGDEKWPHVDLGYSCLARQGTWCVAIGYPAYAGRRRPPVTRVGRVLAVAPWWVATDCPTDGGDSGGPLFDLQARLIAFGPRGSTFRGTAYVSVDAYREASAGLLRGDRYCHPQHLKQQLSMLFGYLPADRTPAARIGMVIPGSSADEAGLEAGDVIVACDGLPVTRHEDVLTMANRNIRGDHPPHAPRIMVVRGEERYSCTLSLTNAARHVAWELLDELVDGSRWLQAHPEVESYSRNSTDIQSLLQPAVDKSRKSVALIYEGGRQTRMGTIVDEDGIIVTTAAGLASEVDCRLHDGRSYPAKVIGRLPRYNLAALKIDAAELSPVKWREGEPTPGSFVLSVHQGDAPISFGVIGTEPRPMARRPGVETLQVPATVSMRYPQLHVGDVVTHVGGVQVNSTDDFKNRLRSHPIGDPLVLEVSRGGRPTTVTLESLGYPEVSLHDAAIVSIHAGGPAVGLGGEALGINVGQSSISACVVSANRVRQLLKRVLEPAADGSSE